MLDELSTTEHDYKTLVVDTLDWLEHLLIDYLLTKNHKNTVQDLGAYGAYVDVVNREWFDFIAKIKKLREKMNILFLAHSEVKRFSDPQQNADYDRYELKIHIKKSGYLFKEFVDCLLFANYEVATREDKTKKTRAYGDGSRVVYTEKRPSHDAKNRYGMPYELPLSYPEVEKHMQVSTEDKTKKAYDYCISLLEGVESEEVYKKALDFVEKNKTKLPALLATQERLKGVIHEQGTN